MQVLSQQNDFKVVYLTYLLPFAGPVCRCRGHKTKTLRVSQCASGLVQERP